MPTTSRARPRSTAKRAATRRKTTTARRKTTTARRKATTARRKTTAVARRKATTLTRRNAAPARAKRAATTKRPMRYGGSRDAIAVLKQDHRDVKAMFRTFRGLGPRALKRKREIADRIVRELSMHASIEEMMLYPSIREVVPRADALVNEAIEEHGKAKDLLRDLSRMRSDDEAFDDTMRRLIADVEHHIREEEGELFPRLRKALSREALVSLGEQMKAAKRFAPTRPHPRAPSKPPANVLTGVVAGAVDRIRDTGRQIVRR